MFGLFNKLGSTTTMYIIRKCKPFHISFNPELRLLFEKNGNTTQSRITKDRNRNRNQHMPPIQVH